RGSARPPHRRSRSTGVHIRDTDETIPIDLDGSRWRSGRCQECPLRLVSIRSSRAPALATISSGQFHHRRTCPPFPRFTSPTPFLVLSPLLLNLTRSDNKERTGEDGGNSNVRRGV